MSAQIIVMNVCKNSSYDTDDKDMIYLDKPGHGMYHSKSWHNSSLQKL